GRARPLLRARQSLRVLPHARGSGSFVGEGADVFRPRPCAPLRARQPADDARRRRAGAGRDQLLLRRSIRLAGTALVQTGSIPVKLETKALAAYDRAIGNTLERNNIQLEKQLTRQVISAN